MPFHLGIEDMEPRNWVAWVFELPGCYARATTRDEAIASTPEAVQEHLARLSGFNLALCSNLQPPFECEVSEEWRALPCPPDDLINAFFENDRLLL